MADQLAPKVITQSSVMGESVDIDDSEDKNEPGIAAVEAVPVIELEASKAINEPDPVDPFKGTKEP